MVLLSDEYKRGLQNVHKYYITPSISGFSPDERNRVTQEFVTPRCPATSAPEYPSSWTAIHETVLRALTSSCLRLPEISSAKDMWGHILNCELAELYSSFEPFPQFTKQDVTPLLHVLSVLYGSI